MRAFTLATAFFSLASAAPFAPYPLTNGFPNPSNDSKAQIQLNAQGTLPNGPPPAKVSDEGVTNLKLIALNEIFEVAFFTQLQQNITNYVPGYELHGQDREFILKTINAVIAQEELHALNANGALAKFGADPIQPCIYQFPVTNFEDAINLARTATDVVLGTLQDVIQIFAENGDAGLARAVTSVVGQEGEQNGFYRYLLGKVPSELPFLTTSDRNFAFTAIQSFAVPNSCPNVNTIPLTTFAPLTALDQPNGLVSQQLRFSYDTSMGNMISRGFESRATDLFVTYINQQNVPVTVPTTKLDSTADSVILSANFPFTENLMNGLTIATLTSSAGPFKNASEVAKATVFGPAFLFAN